MKRFNQAKAIQTLLNSDPGAVLSRNYGLTSIEYTYQNQPALALWFGKKAQPDRHINFTSSHARRAYLESALNTAKVRHNTKPSSHPELINGDIYACTWGAGATHADFYQLKNICSTHYAQFCKIHSQLAAPSNPGYSVLEPLPGVYDGQSFRKKVCVLIIPGQPLSQYFKINSYQFAHKWNGQPITVTKNN